MYTGQQHKRLLRGMEGRSDLRLKVVSAGYGLLDEDDLVQPYNVTFAGMSQGDLASWSRTLRLPDAVKALCREPWWTGMLVLLGKPYLQACEFHRVPAPGFPAMFVCSGESQKFVPRWAKAVTLVVEDCARFSCGHIGLKGEVGSRLLRHPLGFLGLFQEKNVLDRLALDTPVAPA
jgi:hypothetical protein